MKTKMIVSALVAAITVSMTSAFVFADDSDSTFVPDEMITENTVSPEEFEELTGIYVRESTDEEVAEAQSRSLMRAKTSVSLSWGSTNPYTKGEALWGFLVDYNLAKYNIATDYKATRLANTYSQELVSIDGSGTVVISATPDDSYSDSVTVYVHIIDNDSFTETTQAAFTLTNSKKSATIVNPANKDISLIINWANGSYYTRTGEMSITAH